MRAVTPDSDSAHGKRPRNILHSAREPNVALRDSNPMTTFIDDRRVIDAVASPARYFYFSMALACAAVAFLGFAPTFFLPLASGKFSAPPSIMIHGIVFFAWSLFFVYQAWLPAAGQTGRHRTVGIIGVFVGLFQVAGGPESPLRYFEITNPTEAVGFFANRNHFAALLYCLILQRRTTP